MIPALQQFLDYAARYGDKDPRYTLKRIHTLGVLGYMNALLHLEGIDKELADAARIAAVFHDIGRFEQLRRYGTFFDAKSADHAALSCQVLEEEGFLEGQPYRDQILTAIAWHNRLSVQICDPQAELICHLVRDADKLDILRVFATDDIQDVTSHTLEEACQARITPAVKASLMRDEPVKKSDRKNALDIWLTYLGFVSDFHFQPSYRLCEATGFWRRRFDQNRFADPDVAVCVKQAKERLHENRTRSENDTFPDRPSSVSGV